jgi:hypothetical protein
MVLKASVYTRVTRKVSPLSKFFQSWPICIFRVLIVPMNVDSPGRSVNCSRVWRPLDRGMGNLYTRLFILPLEDTVQPRRTGVYSEW